MVTANAVSNNKSRNNIIEDVVHWFTSKFTRKTADKNIEENISPTYFESEEYEREQIRQAVIDHLKEVEYRARRNW